VAASFTHADARPVRASPFSRGDAVDHNRVNEMLTALRDLLHRVGVDTVRGPTAAQDFRGVHVADHFLGVTTETPPDGQPALTDAQYYVKRGLAEYRNTVTAASTGSSTPKFDYDRIALPIPEPVTAWQETVVATNLSELPVNPTLTNRGTHTIPDGTTVHVFVTLSRTNPAFKVYWFVLSGLRYAKVTTYNPTVHPNYAKCNPCDVNGNVSSTNSVRLAFNTNGAVDGIYAAPAGEILAYMPTPGNDGHFAPTPDSGGTFNADGLVVGASRVGSLFYVTLVKDGGSAGSSTAFCTFTYTANMTVYNNGTPSVASLFTGATPDMSTGRIFHMACAPATKGMAYWSGSQFLLAYAHETSAGTKTC
jgi:hypothetical protein